MEKQWKLPSGSCMEYPELSAATVNDVQRRFEGTGNPRVLQTDTQG